MFYEFKNKSDNGIDLYVYGDIVSENVPDWWTGEVSETAVDLKNFKDTVDSLISGQTLSMYFNSAGGSVFAASTMVSMLKRAKSNGVKVVAYIDGLAASAASFLAMAADEINIYDNSVIMVHKPMAGICGYCNADELKKTVDSLDAVESGVMIPLYMSKCKISEEDMAKLIAEESWLTADDIKNTFEVNCIESEKDVAACASDLINKYQNVPKPFMTSAFSSQKPQKAEQKPVEKFDYSDFENTLNTL